MKLHFFFVSLAISLLLTVPAFADCWWCIYDDGPTNGQYNALFIDGPNPGPWNQYISNGFVAAYTGYASVLEFGEWVPTGMTPTTVTWWLGTSAFAGDLGSATVPQVDYTYFANSPYGYDVYNITIILDGLDGYFVAGQTYWLSLGNANDSGNTQFDGWDANYGPATCNFNQGGTNYGDCGLSGGNAFRLYGIPEPGTLVLMGGGILAAAGILRRKIGF